MSGENKRIEWREQKSKRIDDIEDTAAFDEESAIETIEAAAAIEVKDRASYTHTHCCLSQQ